MSSHVSVEPAILYFGTPVALNSSENPDGTFNLAPMSSVFWLGWRCILGFESVSQTLQNIKRTGECVINLPSPDQVDAVNRLALLTGTSPVPDGKKLRGYRFEADKFGVAGLTQQASETVAPPRVQECPVQMEATLVKVDSVMADDYDYMQHPRVAECTVAGIESVEMRIRRVHVHPSMLVPGTDNRIDPNKWRPLIMSFCRFYGLSEELVDSRLATIPESQYRTPDIDRAQAEMAAQTA